MSGAWYEICINLKCVPSHNQPDSIWILDRTGSERMSKLDQHASLNLFYSNQKTGHKPLPLSAALHLFWFLGETGTNGILYLHMLAKPISIYSISQEICTRFLLCCALLWLYIDWFFPYPSGLLHWHCGNLTIAPVPAKQPWWIWINTSCEFIMNDCITTTKQSTTKPCAYFLGHTVWIISPISIVGCNYLS